MGGGHGDQGRADLPAREFIHAAGHAVAISVLYLPEPPSGEGMEVPGVRTWSLGGIGWQSEIHPRQTRLVPARPLIEGLLEGGGDIAAGECIGSALAQVHAGKDFVLPENLKQLRVEAEIVAGAGAVAETLLLGGSLRERWKASDDAERLKSWLMAGGAATKGAAIDEDLLLGRALDCLRPRRELILRTARAIATQQPHEKRCALLFKPHAASQPKARHLWCGPDVRREVTMGTKAELMPLEPHRRFCCWIATEKFAVEHVAEAIHGEGEGEKKKSSVWKRMNGKGSPFSQDEIADALMRLYVGDSVKAERAREDAFARVLDRKPPRRGTTG